VYSEDAHFRMQHIADLGVLYQTMVRNVGCKV
jgi:hypothetical protein